MVENKSSGKQPDYKGDGVAVWVFDDKYKNKYLSIKLIGHDYVKAFKNKKKENNREVPIQIKEVNMGDL